MKLLHSLASLRDANAGTSYSVSGLARALSGLGQDVEVHSLDGWRGDGPPPPLGHASLVEHPLSRGPLLRRIGHSPAMLSALQARADDFDIFHSHGLWLMPNIYPALVRRKSGARVRLVHSVRGMLGPGALRFSRWPKKLIWLALQRKALASADCIHATALSEYEEIRATGMRNPVAVLPNAVELGAAPERVEAPSCDMRTILSLGRIHPKKGLDRLVGAWAMVEDELAGWQVRIVGPAENGHDAELAALVRRYGLKRLTIEPPLNGEEKDRAYDAAALFVLPSLNENFGITVAEALAREVPVISTRGAPWQGLAEHRCGWWIDHGPEPLADALRQAAALPPAELCAMGRRGREWMQRDFSWEKVAERFVATYQWLHGRSARPDWVYD